MQREKTVIIYKNEGETPLQCLDRFRIEKPLYKDAVLSYAGRLDPIAEGALLVIVDEENKNRGKYLGLDKTYEVEILFGISTDTGDILGICSSFPEAFLSFADPDHAFFASFIGPFIQKYPSYSSKPVNGKSLFQWAREGKINEIEIPEKEVEIYNIDLLGSYLMKGEDILRQAKERIAKVKGDFRQEKTVASWEKTLKNRKIESFLIARIEVSCSSGSYMRSLAEAIGKKLRTPSLAWRIKRLLFDAI